LRSVTGGADFLGGRITLQGGSTKYDFLHI
jgi:hypothetical protein